MSGLVSLFKRLRNLNTPPTAPPKNANALRFGILGAARIAPDSLITPAISHPDVVVAAVASRDLARAEAYAKKHAIAKVYAGAGCYQALIDNPEIDAVYVALPNALHFEWTMVALNKGKHVLVEKPIADTAAEARYLVELAASKGLVLLEAIHYTFHPSTQRVKEIIDSGELGKITHISGEFAIPMPADRMFFLKDDVRFNYDLGGGALMDLGVYPLSAMRYLTGTEPVKVAKATANGHSLDVARVDRAMRATLVFPLSVEADLYCDFAMPGWGPLHLIPRWFKIGVRVQLERGEVEFVNYPLPHLYHSITVRPQNGRQRIERVYKFGDGRGEEWWSSYRYQLEAFVDKVRRRTPQTWPTVEEPVLQMQWVESLYAAADMPARPVSQSFSPSV